MRRYVDHPEFNRLVERLYGAFAGRAPEGRVVKWVDMVRPEFEAKCVAEVSRRAVWELSDDVYREVAWHAYCWDFDHGATAWYFLPRMLEAEVAGRVMPSPYLLLDRPDAIAVDLQMLADRLTHLRWRDWPAEQRGAVEAVLAGLWRWELARQAVGADSTTAMLIGLGFDLVSVLREWLGEGAGGALLVARFVSNHQIDGANGTIGMWGADGDRPPAEVERAIIAWLVGGRVAEAIEEAFFAAGSEEERQTLSLAVDVLGTLRNAWAGR